MAVSALRRRRVDARAFTRVIPGWVLQQRAVSPPPQTTLRLREAELYVCGCGASAARPDVGGM